MLTSMFTSTVVMLMWVLAGPHFIIKSLYKCFISPYWNPLILSHATVAMYADDSTIYASAHTPDELTKKFK